MSVQEEYDAEFQHQHHIHTAMDMEFRTPDLPSETPEQRFARDTESTLDVLGMGILGAETDSAVIYVQQILDLVNERRDPAIYSAGLFFAVDGVRKLSKRNLPLVRSFFFGRPIHRGGKEYRLLWDAEVKMFAPACVSKPLP